MIQKNQCITLNRILILTYLSLIQWNNINNIIKGNTKRNIYLFFINTGNIGHLYKVIISYYLKIYLNSK